ncbi:hypothetical protein [Streptomyces sp. RPT161]|uniref:hypothetical protein n=1 Tax=Streptomyces sp. RPT161 TaxID=3015993 RepID=UPI003FCC2A7E
MSPALGIGADTALRDAQVLGAELLAAARRDNPCPRDQRHRRPPQRPWRNRALTSWSADGTRSAAAPSWTRSAPEAVRRISSRPTCGTRDRAPAGAPGHGSRRRLRGDWSWRSHRRWPNAGRV